MDLATAGPSHFEPLVDTPWRAALPDGDALDLVLVAVERGSSGTGPRSFRLVFRGGPTPPLPQGMMSLTHETAGSLELFLVPAAPDADGPLYVAVFG